MSENEKLLADFAAAVSIYALAMNGNPHINQKDAEERVNDLEKKVAARMVSPRKEPL